MPKSHFSMSFTTGGLFQQESADMAQLYLETSSWSIVREQVVANNLLQSRTLSSSRRICNEVISRLKLLSQAELSFLPSAASRDQACLLWLALCRRYKFIGEFATELLRERYTKLQPELTTDDFEAFFHSKSEWHVELQQLTASTRQKLRQVLFKLMKDVGLLSNENLILTPIWNEELVSVLKQSSSASFQYFPIFESDLERFST